MITLDGSEGGGGGQTVRTLLALSLLLGQPIRVHNVRAGRPHPGLLHHHLAAVRAAAQLGRARVAGDQLGSPTLVFEPGTVIPGRHHFEVDDATSTSLILQTVLPALLVAAAPSELLVEGGTHTPFAPSFPFLERSFVPLLQAMGFGLRIELERAGFCPRGGGCLRAWIEPSRGFHRLELQERGPVRAFLSSALVAGLPAEVAHAEHDRLRQRFPDLQCRVEQLPVRFGTGNVVTLECQFDQVRAVFAGFGREGRRIARLVDRLAGRAERFLATGAAVEEHLADQILLPLALAGGGTFTTPEPTRHLRCQGRLLQQLLGHSVHFQLNDRRLWTVTV